MSGAIVDLAKITQMLDSGWQVTLYKKPLGSYAVAARHPDEDRELGLRQLLIDNATPDECGEMYDYEWVDLVHYMGDGDVVADGVTPEHALTRMAYKVRGEIV
ncbi:MAG: hypothetical protein EBY40_01135 [Marivivens sp.]|nr:hypothetical protein [Marivivens sp.]NBT49998.1 hypothetical protein [Marivivens sp.]NCW67382.1 hypothetical protein [Marivivens sp.]NDH01712.1 hypothetical protein [Marivivens sp.]